MEIRWAFFSRFDPIRSTRSSARVYPNEEKKPLPVTSSPTYARNQPAAVVRLSSVARARFCRRQSSFVRSNCSNNEKRASHAREIRESRPFVCPNTTDRPIDRRFLGRAPAAWDRRTQPPLPSPRFDGSRFENQNEIISIRDRSIDRSHAPRARLRQNSTCPTVRIAKMDVF